MKRFMLVAALMVAACMWSYADAQIQYRGTQESNDQIAPALVVFDTTLVTSSSTDVTINFGFFANWVSFEVYTAACSLAWRYDSTLNSTETAVLDTINWVSGRAASGENNMPQLDQDEWNVPAGATGYYEVRVPAIYIDGTGTGSIHIMAGGSGSPKRKGP